MYPFQSFLYTLAMSKRKHSELEAPWSRRIATSCALYEEGTKEKREAYGLFRRRAIRFAKKHWLRMSAPCLLDAQRFCKTVDECVSFGQFLPRVAKLPRACSAFLDSSACLLFADFYSADTYLRILYNEVRLPEDVCVHIVSFLAPADMRALGSLLASLLRSLQKSRSPRVRELAANLLRIAHYYVPDTVAACVR